MTTPKERVLAKYPKAVCIKGNHFCYLVFNRKKELGYHLSPQSAWADAAKRMEEGK